ncbi:histidine phosphatase family protein [Alteribacter natronophilus]|nr:histidine phosphatase family protein [Alteribacter natronophilus]
MEKFGFHLDGVLRETDFDGAEFHNTYVYSQLRKEYLQKYKSPGSTIYLVRHCETSGQEPEAQLTARGLADAELLADFFEDKEITRILTSPFRRAVDTIKPAAVRLKLKVELEERLRERKLSGTNLPEWETWLRRSFEDPDLVLEGGESGNAAASRGYEVIQEAEGDGPVVIVTHGNLLAFLLRNWLPDFGFKQWRNLKNPDVFALRVNGTEASLMPLEIRNKD